MYRNIVLIHVDENGYEIEPVIFDLYDEEGNLREIPSNLVKSNIKSLCKPKWNFETLEWEEDNPDGALVTAIENTLRKYNDECMTIIEKGFYHGEDFFAFSMAKDQANFAQQMTFLLLRPDIQSVDWMTENNGKVTLSRDEFFEVCGSGEIHKRKYMELYWELKKYIINEVRDIETLNSLGSFEEAITILNT